MLEREKRLKLKGDAESADMLTAYEVSRLLRISYYTLLEWRKRGEGPPSVTCSPRVIRYPKHRLRYWLRSLIQTEGKNANHNGKHAGGRA
jgi:hypothetical protein